jgi:hypothetical protein
MTPFEFGVKLAAGPITPPAKSAPSAETLRNYGSPWGPTLYTRAPRPATPSKPYVPNPEHQQILTNLGKQYPQFGKGDLQDMLSLHIQNKGSDLAKFTRNTQQHYKQNPTSAANYVPPTK